MKKILFFLLGISVLIISLSIAYYFVVFLPKNQNAEDKYKKELEKIQKDISGTKSELEIINSRSTINDTEDRLESIEYSIQNQERDRQMQIDCESNGGEYQGSGTCIYR